MWKSLLFYSTAKKESKSFNFFVCKKWYIKNRNHCTFLSVFQYFWNIFLLSKKTLLLGGLHLFFYFYICLTTAVSCFFFGGLLSSTALHCSSSGGSIAFLCEFSFCWCCCFCWCCRRRIRTSLKCICFCCSYCCYWCSSVQWTCQQQQHYPTSKIGHICTFSHHHHHRYQRHATVNSLRKLELLPGTSTSATVPVAAAAAFFCLPASYWQCHLVAQRPAECVLCVLYGTVCLCRCPTRCVCLCVCVMCTALSLAHSL